MRIAFIIPEVKSGGIATYYSNLVRKLLHKGVEVITVLGNYETRAQNPDFPGTVCSILKEDYQRGYQRATGMDIFPSIRQKIALSYACKVCLERAGGADVVEVTDYNMLFYHFLLQKEVPVVIRLAGSSGQLEMHEHREGDGLETVFQFTLEQSLISQADYIISLSQLNKDFWDALLSQPVHLHLPYVNFRDEHLADGAERVSSGLVVGRLQLWKGAKFLCEYYQAYPDSPPVEWLGRDNYYLNYNTSMASHLEGAYPSVWNKKLKFVGRKTYTETQQAIAAASFILIPSIWDTFNFVVAEAMWLGKIVIASNGAGASEIIEDGVNGFLFKAGDCDSMREAFERFRNTPAATLVQIGREARRTVHEKLSNEKLVDERLAVYTKLSSGGLRVNTGLMSFLNEKLQASAGSGLRKLLRQQRVNDLFGALSHKLLSK